MQVFTPIGSAVRFLVRKRTRTDAASITPTCLVMSNLSRELFRWILAHRAIDHAMNRGIKTTRPILHPRIAALDAGETSDSHLGRQFAPPSPYAIWFPVHPQSSSNEANRPCLLPELTRSPSPS